MRYAEYAAPNLLQDAFDCYRRNNLVISQKAFSRRILGHHPSYYSSMKTRDFKPSRRVLETLLSVTKIEVVLVFRPVCGLVKMDQGFI
jgi:hypothetical protein